LLFGLDRSLPNADFIIDFQNLKTTIMENTNINLNVNNITEIEISYKNPVHPADRPVLNQPKLTADLLRQYWNKNTIGYRKEMKLLLLNPGCQLLGIFTLSIGGTGDCLIDKRLLFAVALKGAATRIILAQNHISTDEKPSNSDTIITRGIEKAAELLDIKLLDHVILTETGYYSFAEEGLL
jgi:DNA repair protein RadC